MFSNLGKEMTMKYLLCLLVVAAVFPVCSQEKTLLDIENIEHGGYGAFVTKVTTINGEGAILMGGRGGWIINHTFAIGGGGYGLVNNIHSRNIGPWGEHFVSLGYGGLDLEAIVNSDDIVHFSVHALIGAGSVGFRNDWTDGWDDNSNNYDHHTDGFFVAEPGVNVDLNVTPWFRMSAGASYRYIGGVASDASTNTDLSGPSGMLTFRFGKF